VKRSIIVGLVHEIGADQAIVGIKTSYLQAWIERGPEINAGVGPLEFRSVGIVSGAGHVLRSVAVGGGGGAPGGVRRVSDNASAGIVDGLWIYENLPLCPRQSS
jgi:hypothetical protein